MTWDEITTLVTRAQAGDRSAYGELVQRFEAQELAQEVFVHGMSKLRQLRDPQCFAGWLRQITVRMAINRLTRRGPLHGGDPAVLDNVEARDTDPLETLVRTEAHAELYEGLDRLKPLDRATLVAFYIRGHSLKQMSREFETPVGTIKRRLHVARKRLRRQLEGVGGGTETPQRPRRPKVRRPRELACV